MTFTLVPHRPVFLNYRARKSNGRVPFLRRQTLPLSGRPHHVIGARTHREIQIECHDDHHCCLHDVPYPSHSVTWIHMMPRQYSVDPSERHYGPQILIIVRRPPRWHTRHLNALFGYPEEFRRRHFRGRLL